MALKIKKEIGTDRGITSEAYIRIDSYSVDKKTATLNLHTSMFLNESDAISSSLNLYVSPSMGGSYSANNVYIPSFYEFKMTSSVYEISEVVQPKINESGSLVYDNAGVAEMEYVTESILKSVPDVSMLNSESLFSYSYKRLKDELEYRIGTGSIIDC